jgi:endonuclease YncB( thermonuclease family)
MRSALLSLALLPFVCPSPALAETYDGSRVVIVDGDTFSFGSERFRILNIDTPETFRPRCEAELVLGLKAKERLASLLRAGRVTVRREEQDRYRRALVRVWVRGRDVGDTLVREGRALPWRDGAEAREARLRIWCRSAYY